VQRLTLQGVTVKLYGRFNGNSKPRTIDLKSEDGTEQLTFLTNQGLTLKSLSVNSGTRIAKFKHRADTKSGILSLCLYTPSIGEDLIKSDRACPNQSDDKEASKLATLTLNLGTQPLSLQTQGYQLPPDLNDTLSFKPEPVALKQEIDLHNQSQLEVVLPQRKTFSSPSWVWARENVYSANFFRIEESVANPNDYIEQVPISTIIDGRIRGFAISQTPIEWEIKPGQFLMFSDLTAPKSLEAQELKINKIALTAPNSSPDKTGLILSFAGTTKLLRTGTEPSYPVLEQKSSILQNLLSPWPQELFILVFTGVAGFLGGFSRQLFDRVFPVPESNSSPKP